MTNQCSKSDSSFIGIVLVFVVGFLPILFTALKFVGYIDWSWIWVLSPIWITVIVLVTGFAAFVFLTREDW